MVKTNQFPWLLFVSLSIIITCEENVPANNSVKFLNRTGIPIIIMDNSSLEMFQMATVEPYDEKKITYQCPRTGSCDIKFLYDFSSLNQVCICFDNYRYNEQYTFGYIPTNENIDVDEKCSSCRN